LEVTTTKRQSLALKVRGLIFTNWPIKITAIVLAAILWAATAAQEPSTDLVDVRLEVQPPPGRALAAELPPVKALYAGRARELIKLYAQPPVVSRQLPDTLTGSVYLLELSLADLAVVDNADVSPQDIQPRTISVQLDDVFQRTVPVVPRVSVVPDSGYEQFGGVAVVPGSVVVRGPRELVRTTDELFTVPLELVEATEPATQTVPIDTSALGILRLSHSEVQVSVDVDAVSDQTVVGVPVVVRSERGGEWIVDPPAVTVTVHGRSVRLDQITIDSIRVVAEITGVQRRVVVELEVIPPAGMTAVATPDSATIRRNES
jgi:hypothetical protein